MYFQTHFNSIRNNHSSCLHQKIRWAIGFGCMRDFDLTTYCRISSRTSIYTCKSYGYSLKFARLLFCSWNIDGSANRSVRSQFASNHNFLGVFRSNTWHRIIFCICRIFSVGIILFLLCLHSLL